jgi:signal transduction histidine kinase
MPEHDMAGALGAGAAPTPAPYALSDPGFWHKVFSPSGYMPRAICGQWTPGEIWLHNASDFFIWSAYVAIPIVLIFFWWRRKTELPFRSLFLMFGMFIIACGTTHLMEIVMFYNPLYRLAGLIKLATAIISWGTVAALIPVVPRALVMRSPESLEKEVSERTLELEQANLAKDELLVSEQRARQEAEAARQEAELAREEAESANRAKDEFLMTLSHELRTPLNAIQGWASLLRYSQLSQPEQEEALDIIERNSLAQARLISDLLEVSRIITGKLVIDPHPIELHPIAQAALTAVSPAAHAKEVRLKMEASDKTMVVLGDSTRLQQVVWNLLSNAIKFTPKGGEVTMTISRQDSMAKIEVTDTGEGISTDLLPHVFDRFRQADSSSTRRHGGLGLGLAIVRHITELHGGRVSVTSAGPGLGSTFIVLLPVRTPNSAAINNMATPSLAFDASQTPLEGLRILVVDDEPEARNLVKTILQFHGAQIEAAASAQEAWEQFRDWHPDVLVSDIGMPGENGYALIGRIRKTEAGAVLPSIALTAYASESDRQYSLQAGFDAHLPKPVLPSALIAEIKRLKRTGMN